MISVVIVDDERLVRSGFEALLASDAELEVVATAETGDEALEVVRREKPDVVLMDIRMPGRDGVSATAAITADPALANTRVIVLTNACCTPPCYAQHRRLTKVRRPTTRRAAR